MVEGLTFTSRPPVGSRGRWIVTKPAKAGMTAGTKDDDSIAPAPRGCVSPVPFHGSRSREHTHEILVTLAERPHPFPSRTRQLSSPAPKILRGQLLGKIGRRQDLCVSRGSMRGFADGTPVARCGLPGSRAGMTRWRDHPVVRIASLRGGWRSCARVVSSPGLADRRRLPGGTVLAMLSPPDAERRGREPMTRRTGTP